MRVASYSLPLPLPFYFLSESGLGLGDVVPFFFQVFDHRLELLDCVDPDLESLSSKLLSRGILLAPTRKKPTT